MHERCTKRSMPKRCVAHLAAPLLPSTRDIKGATMPSSFIKPMSLPSMLLRILCEEEGRKIMHDRKAYT